MDFKANSITDQYEGNTELVNVIEQETKYKMGIVMRKDRGRYEVLSDNCRIPCGISNRLRKQLIYPTADPSSLRHAVVKVKAIEHIDPLAIGDQVKFLDAGDGTGLIVEALPRRTMLTRRTAVPMPTAHAFKQIIVANIDQVVPVFAAAHPTPKWNMLDRYLISAESSGLPSLIVITKMDLVSASKEEYKEGLNEIIQEYRRIGYRVIVTSTVTGQGLEELREALHNRVTVFVGKSGVGKTSLLNALQPGLGLVVKEISKSTGKGRHTTSYLEMFSLDKGGAIVDTPGVREFGPWNVYGDDLAYNFPEMQGYVGKCKFGLGCSHEKEPECAIRDAVFRGEISERRYKVYLGFRDETYLPGGHRDI